VLTGDRILVLTAEIVTAYLNAHAVEAAVLPDLIRSIRQTLEALAHNKPDAAEPAGSEQDLIADPRRSVFPDYLVCLEDGMRVSMLRRHLRTAHGMTPEQYRAKWSLPAHYPMVAPNYAKLRSRLAKETGLGRRR
jgi:predicted transcriptional regulator